MAGCGSPVIKFFEHVFPVPAPPLAMCPITMYEVDGSNDVWVKRTSLDQLELCAKVAQVLGLELIQKGHSKEINEDSTSHDFSIQENKITSESYFPSTKIFFRTAATVRGSELDASQVLKSDLHETNKSEFDNLLDSIMEKLVDAIHKCLTTDPLPPLHKLQIVDSGARAPQFHKILPIFLKGMSLYAYVLKLSEELDSHPIVSYYDNCSNAVFQQLNSRVFRTIWIPNRISICIQTHRLATNEGRLPNVLVIGTHKDKMHKCSESLDSKNDQLVHLLLPIFQDSILYHNIPKKEVVHPINAQQPGIEEKEFAKQVCAFLSSTCYPAPRELPLHRYVYEIILHEVMKGLNRSILSKQECMAIAKQVHIDEHTLDAVLFYLDEMSVIFYFPEILPNVVFTNPQVLLDIVTELVIMIYELRKRPHERSHISN